MDFYKQKYLKYKNKYLELKKYNKIQKGGGLIIAEKKFNFNIFYRFKGTGQLRYGTHIDGDLENLSSFYIDGVGFSDKDEYKQYYFEITLAEDNQYPYASIYNLKIHEINDSFKLPESINNKKVSLGTQTGPKYNLTSKDHNNVYTVEGTKYKKYFENYIFECGNTPGTKYNCTIIKVK